VDTIDDLDMTIRGRRADPGLVGKVVKLCETVESLKDDRKWLVSLVLGWVVMTILGMIAVVAVK
jgi:hypothetical protein